VNEQHSKSTVTTQVLFFSQLPFSISSCRLVDFGFSLSLGQTTNFPGLLQVIKILLVTLCHKNSPGSVIKMFSNMQTTLIIKFEPLGTTAARKVYAGREIHLAASLSHPCSLLSLIPCSYLTFLCIFQNWTKVREERPSRLHLIGTDIIPYVSFGYHRIQFLPLSFNMCL
jgi:hypothetical protein